jgi:hypothetical protein
MPKQCSAHPFYTLKVARQKFMVLQTRNVKCRRLDFTLLLNSALKFVTLCWQIVVSSRRIATKNIAIPRIAIVRGPNLRAECHRPELVAGYGKPRHWSAVVSNTVKCSPRHFTSRGRLVETSYIIKEQL